MSEQRVHRPLVAITIGRCQNDLSYGEQRRGRWAVDVEGPKEAGGQCEPELRLAACGWQCAKKGGEAVYPCLEAPWIGSPDRRHPPLALLLHPQPASWTDFTTGAKMLRPTLYVLNCLLEADPHLLIQAYAGCYGPRTADTQTPLASTSTNTRRLPRSPSTTRGRDSQ